MSEWDGRVSITVEGSGVFEWLEEHEYAYMPGNATTGDPSVRLVHAAITSLAYGNPTGSMEFLLRSNRPPTNTLAATLLALRALADLPDAGMLRRASIFVNAAAEWPW